MANFLLTWELGGGLGHLASLRPVALGLARRGHGVVLAVSDVPAARKLIPEVQAVSAPVYLPTAGQAIAEPSTFADILRNAGCSDGELLAGLVAAWRSAFEQFEPQVVVMDFSPLALVALQGWQARKVLLGFGHACPPDVTPLPDLCPWRNNYPERLARTEASVLAALNDQLASQVQPPLDRVAQLYARVDANLLTTFRELDHYSDRGPAEYWGVLGDLSGAPPEWPKGPGPCVFVYLKPKPSALVVLKELVRLGYPTLAFVPGMPQAATLPECDSLTIVDSPLDIGQVAATCDLAILNAGHNATAQILLAGKPILALPISGEQELVATNATKLGAAIRASGESPQEICEALMRLVGDQQYTEAARLFGRKYADFDPEKQIEGILDRLESELEL